MVPTVTSPALNVPAVPSAPAAVSGNPTQTPQTAFKDVYQAQTVTGGGKPESDKGAKQKSAGSKTNPSQKGGGDGDKEKIVVPVAVPASGIVLPKAPLRISVPALGEAAQVTIPDGWAGEALKEVAAEGSAGDANLAAPISHDAAPVVSPSPEARVAPAPRLGTLAISFHLLAPEQPQIHTKAIQQPQPPPMQAAKPAPREVRLAAPPVNAAAVAHESNLSDNIKPAAGPEILMPLHAFSSSPTGDARPTALVYESSEPLHIAATAAVHDVALAPESPKASMTSEILLHLSGKDQTTAAVRVVDRAGTVNVTVHAPDASLRTSLRSNIGELATQLNGQGFKTDLVKPAVLAAHADNARDSRHDGERPSGQQQQSTPGERQSQRQRRTGSERWLDELEQETSGDAGTEGDTN